MPDFIEEPIRAKAVEANDEEAKSIANRYYASSMAEVADPGEEYGALVHETRQEDAAVDVRDKLASAGVVNFTRLDDDGFFKTYVHREDEKLAGVGIIEAHILPKLLEDQARIWMTASDSGYDEAAGDKALAASVMGTDIKDTRVLYAGEMGAARGTFRGELIGAFDDKIYQRIGDNTVVVHKVSAKLSKDRIGQAMEITCSEEKGRVLQQILEFKGDRGFSLGNSAAKEQQAKQEAKQSMGMGW